MTPAARVAAAIDILDTIAEGQPGEKALTNWARSHRFAGSGDRAAIRDHVFDVLRRQRSCAALGGGTTGRALMIGALRIAGLDPAELFTGQGYGPSPLTDDETAFTADQLSEGEQLDCPDWLLPMFRDSLGDDTPAVLQQMQTRAPLFLRVNLAKGTVSDAIQALTDDGVGVEPHALSPAALIVTSSPRRVQNGEAYKTGLVEIQDAASQAVVDLLPLRDGMSVLDYCAGGGGKSLAMAARAEIDLTAHDRDQGRMVDIPVRAERAGADIDVLNGEPVSGTTYDLVLCDVPCSGSGSWRRAPEAKWQFTPDRLIELCAIQAQILNETQALVSPGGCLAYVTCSMFNAENQDQIAKFLAANPAWSMVKDRAFTPLDGGDGFFVALLTRE